MPLNADRAFVATSLIHAAFELGNPDTTTLGVDPHAGEDSFAKIKAFLSLALYKGKVIVHGLLHKILLGYTTSPAFYFYAKPWLGTTLCSVVWDAFIGHCIINQAQLRGIGVYASAELFNEVLENHFKSLPILASEAAKGETKGSRRRSNTGPDPLRLSSCCRVQIARAVGVAIVLQGSMYSLHSKSQPAISTTSLQHLDSPTFLT